MKSKEIYKLNARFVNLISTFSQSGKGRLAFSLPGFNKCFGWIVDLKRLGLKMNHSAEIVANMLIGLFRFHPQPVILFTFSLEKKILVVLASILLNYPDCFNLFCRPLTPELNPLVLFAAFSSLCSNSG